MDEDVPEQTGGRYARKGDPLLDEIEFKALCDRYVDTFTSIGVNQFDGCCMAFLGPFQPDEPMWALDGGKYDGLSEREARMLATVLVERLGLIYSPPEAFAWVEVLTSRFTVSSRTPELLPPMHMTKG